MPEGQTWKQVSLLPYYGTRPLPNDFANYF